MLDVECSLRGCSETYVQKIKVQHKDNKKLFEPNHCDLSRTFGIHHYAGPVIYDSSQFLGMISNYIDVNDNNFWSPIILKIGTTFFIDYCV